MYKPLQERITREIISELSDKDLPFKTWDHIWFKVGKNYKELEKILAGLPPGFRVIYHLFALNGEINNGGFNQYFFNSGDEEAAQQADALKSIAATKHQEIFANAFELREEERKDQELQSLYAERTLESFSKSYKRTSLGKCDDEWYALRNELNQSMARFIREHTEMFVEPE